ncbi:prolactin-inducible protein homolog precursor [Cavia porcellus]|uniref:Prolactin-inducible protein homolog n=1 Tax=Cavia porcellus TaxID=10141 RepID=PIP_CAVPO|nr:prolactin-inducible protein homolog precursor [Cavia porcellus]P60987.1 RecName: Full=Prolactin-inducible protein homolog; AltName: Full=Prolactin-induced protein; Flags: Precursor [Cavia porcellus]BAD04927.1 prolactin inducible protein [Cavia porcellus]
MLTFQFLFRASPATLLLTLYLQLGVITAQEDTRRTIILSTELPQEVTANELTTLKLKVETELRECMVIKAYLVSSKPLAGPFNYKYTGCLCSDYPRTFYWDFQTNSTVRIATVVDIIRELNICPDDQAVVPIKSNRYYAITDLTVN